MIELHAIHGPDGESRLIALNPRYIARIDRDEHGRTRVWQQDGSYDYVTEKYLEVLHRINYPVPPL